MIWPTGPGGGKSLGSLASLNMNGLFMGVSFSVSEGAVGWVTVTVVELPTQPTVDRIAKDQRWPHYALTDHASCLTGMIHPLHVPSLILGCIHVQYLQTSHPSRDRTTQMPGSGTT